MKKYFSKKEGSWVEIIDIKLTKSQLSILSAPDTEENKEEKLLLMEEINNSRELQISDEKKQELNMLYFLEKQKINNSDSESFKLDACNIYEITNEALNKIDIKGEIRCIINGLPVLQLIK